MPRKKNETKDPDWLSTEESKGWLPFPILSVQIPWALLMIYGLKLIENRNQENVTWNGWPVAIYVPLTTGRCSDKKLKEILQKPTVQNAFNRSALHQNMNADQLVEHLRSMQGKILGWVYFTREIPSDQSFPFYDYPIQTSHHWRIDKIERLDEPVDVARLGFKGRQSFAYINSKNIMRTFLKSVPGKLIYQICNPT